MSNSLLVKEVSKFFGNVQALKDIHLEAGDGEFIALLGPSGCGKTTLLRLIAGFETPTQGRILIDGKIVAADKYVTPPEERGIGMVFQSLALWPHMTVCENVVFPLNYRANRLQEDRAAKDRRVRDILEIVGLSGFEKRLPGQLSGGQKQRVALARAFVSRPPLLLMDEPLSSLDAELRIQMRREIQEIHRKLGTTILYVTHDQSEALAMADRIVVMKEGKMEQVGSPEEVYFSPKTKFVAKFVGKANFLKGKWLDRKTFCFSYGKDPVLIHPHGDLLPFLEEDLLPVRPEQVKLSRMKGDQQTALSGIIENVQFQGKEMIYSIRVRDSLLEVQSGIEEIFHRHESVSVQLDV